MRRYLFLLFGVANYVAFLGVSLYLAGFLLNLGVPRGIDGPARDPWLMAVCIDVALVGLFGLQHSVMARPQFKRWWTRWIPAPLERSTYVLASNLALIVLFWQWRPFGPEIWRVEAWWAQATVLGVFVLGWGTVVGSTFLIHHFELFGLRQVWNYFRNQPDRPIPFATPGPYRLVRHPLYVGWTLVFWATPTMTLPHLLLATGMTTYILLAIPFEEQDLQAQHGARYTEYRNRTPMLIPRLDLRLYADREARP